VSIVEEQSQIITAQNTLIKDLKNTNTVELGAVTNDLPLSYSEVTKKSSVILRPKNENPAASDIKKDLFTNIDPIASKIAISNIKGNRSGGVIITCDSLEDSTRIKGLISDRLSGYNVKDLPLLHPRVRIWHIDSSVSQDKLLEYTVCPRIEFTRGKKKIFLILRKNFRGITFFASSETPISVIKKSFSTQRKT
jgi:hypothetical protein